MSGKKGSSAETQEVYIIDADGNKFKGHIMSDRPARRARMIRHPVESGGVVFDNKIVEPMHIDVRVVVNWKDTATLDMIERMIFNRSYRFCTIQIKGSKDPYVNMELVSESHDESPERFDAYEYHLVFDEVMFGTKSENSPKDKANASTKSS